MNENQVTEHHQQKFRGSGRTTRMLEYAIEQARSGNHIVIVAHNWNHLNNLRHMLNTRLILAQVAHEFEAPDKWYLVHNSKGSIELYGFDVSRWPEFNWTKVALIVPTRHEKSEILVDHYSLETVFPAITNMLYRFMEE